MNSQRTEAPAARRFKARVQAWAIKIRVAPKQIRVQKMTRKWASCSTLGWVSFSEDLLDESRLFQDYVIVHELLHLKVRNHGKLFKSLLRAYLQRPIDVQSKRHAERPQTRHRRRKSANAHPCQVMIHAAGRQRQSKQTEVASFM